MKKIKLFGYLILALLFTIPCWAQMLDDEDFSGDASEYDTLFDEMYSNDESNDKAKTVSSIEDVAKSISVKIANEKKQETSRAEEEKQLEPLDGGISIGVSRGSFKVFQDVIGRTTCTFGVTLKSNLNRDIRNISLRLMYQNRAFAFIYKNIKELYNELCK